MEEGTESFSFFKPIPHLLQNNTLPLAHHTSPSLSTLWFFLASCESYWFPFSALCWFSKLLLLFFFHSTDCGFSLFTFQRRCGTEDQTTSYLTNMIAGFTRLCEQGEKGFRHHTRGGHHHHHHRGKVIGWKESERQRLNNKRLKNFGFEKKEPYCLSASPDRWRKCQWYFKWLANRAAFFI